MLVGVFKCTRILSLLSEGEEGKGLNLQLSSEGREAIKGLNLPLSSEGKEARVSTVNFPLSGGRQGSQSPTLF